MATTKMDLDRDYNINGVQYNKGKQVEVQSDHAQAIKDLTADNDTALEYQSTHHGAVPPVEDPTAATAQTPTRPLGDDHLRMAQVVKPDVTTGDVQKVEEPKATDGIKADETVKTSDNPDVVGQ